MTPFRRIRQWSRRASVVLTLAATFGGQPGEALAQRELAFCADPDNLPFSNVNLEGFENKIAALIAEDLHATPRFEWMIQRRGFLRRTLQSGLCDVLMGATQGLPGVAVTRPYYRSAYAFVWRSSRHLALQGFDDPALKSLRIGLHAIGAEGANTPPAMALARRGISRNIVGYSMWSETEDETGQPGHIIDAVARNEIDTAIVWGPIAGYFARRYAQQLTISTIERDQAMPATAFAFDIAMGVRQGDDALKRQLQEVLDRRQDDIQTILLDYQVPLLALAPNPPTHSSLEAPSGEITGATHPIGQATRSALH